MARFYYHVTNQDFGKEVVLIPRKYGDNRSDEEPQLPRICVAPTIEGCLISLGLNCIDVDKQLNIYRTKYKVETMKPYDVCDAYITGERWVVDPTSFVRYGTIKLYVKLVDILNIYTGDPSKTSLNKQKKHLDRLKKLKKYYVKKDRLCL